MIQFTTDLSEVKIPFIAAPAMPFKELATLKLKFSETPKQSAEEMYRELMEAKKELKGEEMEKQQELFPLGKMRPDYEALAKACLDETEELKASNALAKRRMEYLANRFRLLRVIIDAEDDLANLKMI